MGMAWAWHAMCESAFKESAAWLLEMLTQNGSQAKHLL